ncbi:MAG: CDP-alcohol phosphatidyltransferase family protein [Magnetococcales bacterium]|nr:CDP-alcohol phosphatidyltransferase family protein [Magnetococcales bacterium]
MGNLKKPLLTPNQITVSRFVLIFPLFALWFAMPDVTTRTLICLTFTLIFAFDAVDGLVARTYNMGSTFGVYFDPIVDHISYFALCIMLIDAGYLSLWFLFLIIIRDLLVVFIKQYAAAMNQVIKASFLAKAKAELVSVPLACLYLMNVVDATIQPLILLGIVVYLLSFKYIFKATYEHTVTLRAALVVLAVIFWLRPEEIELAVYYETIYTWMTLIAVWGSAALYFWNSWDLLFSESKGV